MAIIGGFDYGGGDLATLDGANYGPVADPIIWSPYSQPSDADIAAWEEEMRQRQQNFAPDYSPSGEFDFSPYEYNTYAGDGFPRPTSPSGGDVTADQFNDWYFNNQDAQPYINNYWNGGNGNLDPGGGTTTPPPATGGNGGSTIPPPASGGNTGGGGASAPNSDWSTGIAPYGPGWPSISNPEKIEQYAEQNRLQAGAWGDLLDQTLRDYQNTYQNFEGNFRDWALNGPGGYSNILNGGGGFSDDERANLLQEQMLRGGMATDADYAANYFTPEEISAIQGDPYAAYNMAIGNLGYLDQWLREGDATQRAAVSALDTDLNAAVRPDELNLSDEYNQNFQFGDAHAQLMADQAARIVGANAAAREQQLRDAAFAHGNTSPLALADAQARNRVQGDIASADAITDARLKAKGLQLDVASQREAARQAAARDLSDRQMANASQIRQTQLATEKGISDAWNDYGRYNTNLKVDTTGQAEAAVSNRAGQLATNRQNANQQNINTRFGQAGTASTALSGRYGTVYGQKKAEEAEGRKFLGDEQDRAQAGANNALNQRTGLYGTRLGGLNTATGLVINAKSLPTALDKGLGFVSGMIGG